MTSVAFFYKYYMNSRELFDFNIHDAVKFHNQLNPALFDDDHLRPDVRKQLLTIAQDFIDHLGVKNVEVKDITLSGSNAAFTYTPHSDIDLHILVDLDSYNNDEIYRELFNSKKVLYNDSHDIKVHGYDVELYVQDTAEPVKSLGEYSVSRDRWIKYPGKTQSNLDERATREKFKKLIQLSQMAITGGSLSQLDDLIDTIKRYRQAGLDEHGEFGPENLAYKALRSQGIVQQLYDKRDQLHSQDLSIDEAVFFTDPGQLIDLYLKQIDGSDLSKSTLTKILKGLPYNKLDSAINVLAKKYKIKPTDIVWQPSSTNEDYDPNGPPPGPETKPTMPAGTVRVDVSDVYDWYKLGQHISNLKGLGHHDFGMGPPSTIMAFGSEPEEHKYIKDLEKTGLTTTDIDPADKNQPPGMKPQKTDPTFNVNENASGYIPSNAERNDPRYKTGLTVDVKPDSIKRNAIKLGLGIIDRTGVPQIAKSNGKFK